MKTQTIKFFTACLFIAGFVGTAMAQSFTDPVFKPATTAVDFGEVDSKTDAGYRILKFKNEGSSPLTITNIKPSCGCTTPEWPKDPIKAGATAEIKVKYDITRIGIISKTITIVTNEPDGKDANGAVIYKQHIIPVKGNIN